MILSCAVSVILLSEVNSLLNNQKVLLLTGQAGLFSLTSQDGLWQPHNIQGSRVPLESLSRLIAKETDLLHK